MHRQPLLDALETYFSRHPAEAETVGPFRQFVEAEPDCFERHLSKGHVTGSAWILSSDQQRVLLTHHRKLNRWLQLGGHADGDPDVLAVALREAREESGLHDFELVLPGIFDLDIHPIPARASEPAHFHYDVRYLLLATGDESYTVSEESHDLSWVPLSEVPQRVQETSMLRMLEKCQNIQPGIA
ncbi:8-oxo-dGTP pyrophosphatase MutT (NUDIX family) [Haloferula luteola]|uniref:8-oxo-dGTP pyrophosphatase MutT (NUDIX family) n=1 Tax=Haloferula luteola TaxID=595692 RepID=A0A840V9G6_9BACT|nr:NUDIX hydrolase [Haloferula luteola]MBB5350600.1 8-oxo-dGTP pyrophosphatase MutT (NUDIX family) [Haloferula luteola]